MPLTPQERRFERAVRGFYFWLGAFLVALLLPFAAQALVASDSPLTRVAGVALGILSWVPIVLVVLATVRAGDEYQRRLHVTAGAVSFLIGFAILLVWSWLVEAAFTPLPSLRIVWIVVTMSWAASVLGVKRYFERRV